MADEEDDKPTVVLDINALKKEMEEKKDEMADIAEDISFSATADDETSDDDKASTEEASEEVDLDSLFDEGEGETQEETSFPDVLLFDFNSSFFAENHSKLPQEFNYTVISELKALNSSMQESQEKIVIFNYNAAPKAVNQLTIQIKSKFPKVKTVIMAKNLSDEKAEQHRKTKSGAHAYLSVPFKNDKMIDVLKSV